MRRANLCPILQNDSARACHSRVSIWATRRGSPNLDAQFSSRCCQRLRDRAHASHHVAVESLQLVFSAAQQMKQQTQSPSRADKVRHACHTRCWRGTCVLIVSDS